MNTPALRKGKAGAASDQPAPACHQRGRARTKPQPECPQGAAGPACCFLCPWSSWGRRLNLAPKTAKRMAQVVQGTKFGKTNQKKILLFNKKIPFKSIQGFDERMKQKSFRTKARKRTSNFGFSKEERRSSFSGIKHALK